MTEIYGSVGPLFCRVLHSALCWLCFTTLREINLRSPLVRRLFTLSLISGKSLPVCRTAFLVRLRQYVRLSFWNFSVPFPFSLLQPDNFISDVRILLDATLFVLIRLYLF